jgi:PAS domain S-box-containing protein
MGGESLHTVQNLTVEPKIWTFSHEGLAKFGYSEASLPEGSVILWQPSNFITRNPWTFTGISAFVVFQTLLIGALIMNIRKRQVVSRGLRHNEAKMRLLIEHSPLAISISDASGRILLINKKHKQLLGYDISELRTLSHMFELIIHDPVYRQKVLEHYEQSMDDPAGEPQVRAPVEYRATAKDGRILDLEVHFTDSDGLRFRVIRDVTERNRDLAELRETTKAAQMASEAKSRFLSNVSHEIRTPMNGVLGMVQLLRETRISPDQRDYIDTIQDSCDLLVSVINDILDLSKIESGSMTIERVPMDLRSFLRSIAGIAAATIEAKGLEFVCNISEDLPDTISCDPNRLKQILLNLLVNASKFTDTGRVELHVRATGTSGNAGTIHFDVSDTGIGIDQSLQRDVFEPFVQVDASATRRHGGTGLGLSICKRLIEMLGGEITLVSVPGKGSKFSFDIKAAFLQKMDLQTRVSDSIDASMAERCPMRILVAEDNLVNQKVVHIMLQKMGYDADVACNGMEAVEKTLLNMYDLILMDVQMPVMDGLSATMKIRALVPESRQPRIIALTAHALGDDVQRCVNAGMNAHLSKPLRAALLRNALVNAFHDIQLSSSQQK